MTMKTPKYATTAEVQAKCTPHDVLAELKAGNARFQAGQLQPRDVNALIKYTVEQGQHPVAIVLSCMDSRSVPEIVFDQSIGDIFTARVAGNVVDETILASMEFAADQMGAKLIAVMGHSHCGTITAACKTQEVSGYLRTLLSNIRASFPEAVQQVKADQCEQTLINQMVKQNVLSTLQQTLQQSVILESAVKAQQILLVGAMHWLETGKVEFFDLDGNPI